MYGFSDDLDLSEIVGCDLNQIRIGRHDVQFVFGSTILAVQGSVDLIEQKEVVAIWTDDKSWSNLEFLRLLNSAVSGYSVLDNRMLEICFTDGLRLRFYDSQQFETMQVYKHGDIDATYII